MRLTKERRAEIKERVWGAYNRKAMMDLFMEIDALEKDSIYLKNNARIKFENNVKLRERIAKLREGLLHFSNSKRRTVFDIGPDSKPTEVRLMIEADSEVADQALARDDEMEKQG